MIDQARIDRFAEATDDHQWIHADPEAAADGPFGATIAHGYLTLALVNRFMPDLLTVTDASMGVNYGCEKVRRLISRRRTAISRLLSSGHQMAPSTIAFWWSCSRWQDSSQ